MRDGYVDVGGLRLHVVEEGDPSAPPVVLLHGFPEFWYSWRHQLPSLAAAGFRVIAPDLRGYNLSDKPARVSDYGIDKLASDVVALIAAVTGDGRGRDGGGEGEGPVRPVRLVGHDWGAAVAWQVAMHHPDVVERLAIIAGPHPADMAHALLHDAAQRRRSAYMFLFQLPFLPELWLRGERLRVHLRRWNGTARVFSEEDLDRYVEAFARPGAMHSALNYYRAAMRGFMRAHQRKSPPVRARTLVLWGERDFVLGVPLTHHLPRRVTGPLTVEVLPGLGHFLHEQAPDLVNGKLVEFLRAP